MSKREHTEPMAGMSTFAFADVQIDARAHRLLRDGREVAIEPKAFAVLLEFLAHPGQLLTRDQLLDAVWGHSFVTPATLNRIVAQLRKALDDDSESPHCIQTVHGLGYRFIAPIEPIREAPVPVLKFAPPAQARLPGRTTPLVGRGRDVAAIAAALGQNRLVTVVGPGGIGKTQVALESARACAAGFQDGVWLIDCTPLADRVALVVRFTGMFDIRGTSDAEDLLARLGELLQDRHALLVFDNAERIAEPLGDMLAALLAGCAALCVLVTSQRRLNCAGEALHWLQPLEVPPPGEWKTARDLTSLAQVSSVQLLLLRLQAFATNFTLSPANAAPMAEICRRLEGLPLALELAAARLRLLSPEQLLARLNDRVLALAEVNPARPAHHQTLHALIEWSFALLSDREQALLCGLSVFVGVCTLDGARAVGAAFGFDDAQTLDLLGSLIDKSLLGVDIAGNPPRYHLLDSVRLFALAKLVESGMETRVRDAHLAHFVRFTERVDAEVRGAAEQLWAGRVKREWANLHAAFDHALTRADLAGSALALVGNLCWYFRTGTDYIEPARWLDAALQLSSPPTRHRALALIAAGMVGHQSQLHARAVARLRESIELAGELGDAWLQATGQAILAFELATTGDFAGADRCVEAALADAVSRDDSWLCSMALLGRGVTQALNNRHREAVACLDDAFRHASSPGNGTFQQAYVLINLALQRYYLGDLQGAARDWSQDLDLFLELQHWRGAAGCVEGAAYLASGHGDAARAARWLAAAARVRELTGAPLMPQWRKAQQIAERKAQVALGPEFERVQQAGASARFEDVVAEARALLTEIAGTQPARTGASKPSGS